MGLANDLLSQATHLTDYQEVASQASLRRAVSTAYYALFHLLIADASSRWDGTEESRTAVQRGFQHGSMVKASREFSKRLWEDWQSNKREVPVNIQAVATTFVMLQEKRTSADYDNSRTWTKKEVQTVLNQTSIAFLLWHSIRHVPMAGNYLMAMFLGKQR
jgi:uncharacterized protein (UPF0332 family)